jgi:hypothetical protein
VRREYIQVLSDGYCARAGLDKRSLGRKPHPSNAEILICEVIPVWRIDSWLALGVFASTAATDAVYVMFNAAVSSRRRVPAATWSSLWYLLSAFAVISYTRNWVYVGFAAAGSWVGAYLSMTLLRKSRADTI